MILHIPADFHSPYSPYNCVIEPSPPIYGKRRYSIRIPYQKNVHDNVWVTSHPDGDFIVANSKYKPVLIIGDGTDLEFNQFEKLCRTAKRWNFNVNNILNNRRLDVAVNWYDMNVPGLERKEGAGLIAVDAVHHRF